MLFAILLLPLVASLPTQVIRGTYILRIENNVLKGVQSNGEISDHLDLSNLELKNIERSAFDNLPDLKSLILTNNSLSTLPDFIFSNLTSLEHLSLAENKINSVKYLFVGLETLKSLNLSYNPISHLRRGHLFGLTKSTDICTKGNIFWSISTGVFANSFLKDEEELKEVQRVMDKKSLMEEKEKIEMEMDTLARDTAVALTLQDTKKSGRLLSKDLRLKLCMSDDYVTSLEILKGDDELNEECSQVPINLHERTISLKGLGIKGFQEGWYQVRSLPIASIDLSNNEISEITKELLNDLPADLVYVSLQENRIRRIWSQVIENDHLKMLNLKNNVIDAIEDGAFLKTNLSGLFLTGNQLETLDFISTLPKTLSELGVIGNELTAIPPGIFSNLPKLNYLNFGNNKIAKLEADTFEGLEKLRVLILTRNNISEIHPDAFRGLNNLETLYIYKNHITDFQEGTFAKLENLKDLNLAWNRLPKVTKTMFADLPSTVDFLHLDHNKITSLEPGSFKQVPRFTLSLNDNLISRIPRGVFDLPSLQDLYLGKNRLTTIEGDSYEGLSHLKRLWLAENHIATISKYSCKNLGGLNVLDISKNPFEKLENGALYGLTETKGAFVYVYSNHLELMQGGVFDDV